MDEQLQRPVAIKRLHEEGNLAEGVRDAWMEARALASLQHPNIVTLFDFGEDTDGVFFVMEYIAGETLEKLGTMALLAENDFRNVAKQCLAGIGAAHELGIVHRDIKPTNIMVQQGASGELLAKILDFGLAKFQKAPERQTTDHEDNLLGSIYFMAPEQFSREPIDGRADLYALGNVFYYTLTGKMAHAADSIQQIIYSHLFKTPVSLAELRPDLSPALCLWVHQLMQRDPVERPQNTREALDLLDPENVPVHAAPAKPRFELPQERPESPWLLWISIIGVVVGVLAGTGLYLAKHNRDSKTSGPSLVVPAVPAQDPVAVIRDPLPVREPSRGVDPAPVVRSVEEVDPLDKEALVAAKGREVQVFGIPVKVGENKNGTILYLNFSEDYRSALSLIFFVKDKPDQFSKDNLEPFLNKKVSVQGIIGEYNGAPQIRIGSLEQIKIQSE